MNTPRTHRYAAVAAAAFMTLAMLFSVNTLAVSDAPAALMAMVHSTRA
jgi:hypothetical protein